MMTSAKEYLLYTILSWTVMGICLVAKFTANNPFTYWSGRVGGWISFVALVYCSVVLGVELFGTPKTDEQ